MRFRTKLALLVLALAPDLGRAEDTGFPEPRPLGAGLPALGPEAIDAENPAPAAADLTGVITLRDASGAALLHNPSLAVELWEVRARDARMLQAGLRPNPEAGLEVEDIGASGPFAGVDEAQITLSLGQLLELGGKREARVEASRRDRDLAGWDYETRRLDVLADTTAAFVAVVGAQEALEVRADTVRIADEVIQIAEQRLRAGIAPEAEVTRARQALSEAEAARDASRAALEVARRALASSWGASASRFERADGSLRGEIELPAFDVVLDRLRESPELARWPAEEESRRATLALERARAVPDVTVLGGLRRLFGPDRFTFVGGVSVPLPVANRNQGAIAEAQYRLSRARADRRRAETSAEAEAGATYALLQGLVLQAARYRQQVLPEAQTAVLQVRTAYEHGRLGQLDVLSAERTLAEARITDVDLRTRIHLVTTRLERLLGAPLETRP